MSKPSPSNSMPWPENLIYDFHLPPTMSPEAAEAFINTLHTSDKNKEFLILRYRDGQSYADIAPRYGISAGGVRQAVKYVKDRYLATADASPVAITVTDVDSTSTATSVSIPSTDTSTDTESSLDSTSADSENSVDTPAADPESSLASASADTEGRPDTPSADSKNSLASSSNMDSAPQKKPIREELKPIITAIANTTRQRNFVYDTKTRVVTPTDQIPRGLRRNSRYIRLPDYYQIREYDLMQEFANNLADVSPDLDENTILAKAELLNTALGGLGPFKAFQSTVRDIGLGQAWSDYRYQRFADMAEDWWDREVAPALFSRKEDIKDVATTLMDDMSAVSNSSSKVSNTSSEIDTPDIAGASSSAEQSENGVLIVDPATLNDIGLIETIRILYRRVGPVNFEEALDELRDAMCSISTAVAEGQ